MEKKQNWEEAKKHQNLIRNEIINLLKENQVTYMEALEILKNAHSYIERAALSHLV